MGSKLIIPVTAGRSDSETAAYSKHPTHYKVRKGDTLASVADDFDVPVEKLRKWNHLRGSALTVGRTLVIYKPLTGDTPEVAYSRGLGHEIQDRVSQQEEQRQDLNPCQVPQGEEG